MVANHLTCIKHFFPLLAKWSFLKLFGRLFWPRIKACTFYLKKNNSSAYLKHYLPWPRPPSLSFRSPVIHVEFGLKKLQAPFFICMFIIICIGPFHGSSFCHPSRKGGWADLHGKENQSDGKEHWIWPIENEIRRSTPNGVNVMLVPLFCLISTPDSLPGWEKEENLEKKVAFCDGRFCLACLAVALYITAALSIYHSISELCHCATVLLL